MQLKNGLLVEHVSGKSNIPHIFTKEMQDGANFSCRCDSFMCRLGDYLCGAHNIAQSSSSPPLDIIPLSSLSPTSHIPVLVQSAVCACSTCPGILDILISYSSLCLSTMLTTVSTMGCLILSRLAPSSYMQALLSNMGGGST